MSNRDHASRPEHIVDCRPPRQPLLPWFGSGRLDEIGAGRGEGTIINVPVPAGTGDEAYPKAFRDITIPWFHPDLILASAGFDPHWHDLALNVPFLAGLAP